MLFTRTCLCALLVALLSSCTGGAVSPDDSTTTPGCVTDLDCPMGEECGALSCYGVEPGLYVHIQTASPLLREYNDASEVSWRASHYDLMIGQVLSVADQIRAINPRARLFEYMSMRYMRYNEFGNEATNWALAHGADPEDFYLHYREDVEVPTWEGTVLVEGFPAGVVPGWVPGVSPIPGASAETREQSQVIGYNAGGGGTGPPWRLANVTNDSYRDFLLDWATRLVEGTGGAQLDGIVGDNAIYYPQFGEGVLDKTNEFYGIPLDEQHPYARGFETLYPELARRLASRFGRAVDVMPNYGHVSFLSYNNLAAKNVVASTPWIWAEVWLTYLGWSSPTTGSLRAMTYDADYQKAIAAVVRQTRQSKRRVLGARDLSSSSFGTDRGRILTLALYYLVHNENTFYAYETVASHASQLPFSQWQWNPAVEFDVGVPDQIPPGTTDFDGNYSSNEHYEFATGPDPYRPDLTYHVFARRFTNALVLVKMLPAGSVTSNYSATTHALDGTYAPLLADGTLGDVVTSVTLCNNEAVILIPVD